MRWRGLVGDRETWSLGVALEVQASRGALRFSYDCARPGERIGCAPVVALEGEPMRFGGVRWWARCPACSRRCGVVYVSGPRLACRRCLGLAYESTRRSDDARARTLMRTLAERLGADGSEALEWGLPEKPARMRRRTYERIAARFRAAEARYHAALVRMSARYLGVRGRGL